MLVSGKRLAVGLALSFVPVLSFAQGSPPQRNPLVVQLEQAIAGREEQPAEQVFRNIQTFKGRPAIGVLRIMEMAFVPNLGVECSYCHDITQWESDAKPAKGIARGMWTLRESIRQQVRTLTGKPDVAVTCYMCHRGQPKPAFAPGR